nr:uncharacterized protein LOC129058782 isoform X2 [Pongo abelii]
MRGLSVQRLVVLLKACASRRGTPGSVSGSNSSAPSLNTSAHERNTWKPSVICVCNVCERMEPFKKRQDCYHFSPQSDERKQRRRRNRTQESVSRLVHSRPTPINRLEPLPGRSQGLGRRLQLPAGRAAPPALILHWPSGGGD